MIPLPPITLVTAPGEARVRSLATVGATVAPGDVVAVLDAARGPVSLLAGVHGRVGGRLTVADQPVVGGDGVVWIQR